MSRDSTPVTLIGDLAIASSPESSTSDMPVTTRGMLQGHRNTSTSLGGTAGSSRAAASSSRRRPTGGSSGRAARPLAGRHRTARNQATDRNDGDDSDDGSDSDDEDPDQIINEIMSTFADTHPTPAEFSRISPENARDILATEQTRDCRRLARILSGTVERDQEVLTVLRRSFPRNYCAARLVNNLWSRDAAILRNLYANLEDQANGRDVPDSIADWHTLNTAIESVLTEYWTALTEVHRRSLASLLIAIMARIFQTDNDLYAGRNRTVYAGETSGGNLFRCFLSARNEPIDFLSPLQRLDANLLRSQTAGLRDLINRYRANGANSSGQDQYNHVSQALIGIWIRANGAAG